MLLEDDFKLIIDVLADDEIGLLQLANTIQSVLGKIIINNLKVIDIDHKTETLITTLSLSLQRLF